MEIICQGVPYEGVDNLQLTPWQFSQLIILVVATKELDNSLLQLECQSKGNLIVLGVSLHATQIIQEIISAYLDLY